MNDQIVPFVLVPTACLAVGGLAAFVRGDRRLSETLGTLGIESKGRLYRLLTWRNPGSAASIAVVMFAFISGTAHPLAIVAVPLLVVAMVSWGWAAGGKVIREARISSPTDGLVLKYSLIRNAGWSSIALSFWSLIVLWRLAS